MSSCPDDGAPRGLEEEVGHPAVRLPFPGGGRELLLSAALADVRVEVAGRVHDLPGVLDGRLRIHGVQIVDEAGPAAPREHSLADEVVDDLVQPGPEPVLVEADELEHVLGHGHLREGRVLLQVVIRLLDLDDEPVAQDEADRLHAVDLERAHIERLGALRRLGGHLHRRQRQQEGACQGDGCEAHGTPPSGGCSVGRAAEPHE